MKRINSFSEEVERVFNLMRRVYAKSNTKDNFTYRRFYFGWIGNEDICLDNLSDNDLFCLVVALYNWYEYATPSKAFEVFGWDKKKVYKLANKEEFIYSRPVFSESTGLLAGRGYSIEHDVFREAELLYKNFLWNDVSVIPDDSLLRIEVDIPGIYKGILWGHKISGVFSVRRPSGIFDVNTEAWPIEKRTMEITNKNVIRWKYFLD